MRGLLILLAAVGVALLALLRRRSALGPRAPRPRHIVIRIVCGVLGVGILAAVAVGTWSVVHGSDAGEAAGKERLVCVPTQPPPALAVPEEPFESVEVKQARFLVNVIIADLSAGEPVVIFADQQELRWPRFCSLGRDFDVAGYKVRYEIALRALSACKEGPKATPTLRSDGKYNFDWQRGGSSSGTGGGLMLGGVWFARRMGRAGPPEKPPLSIVARPGRELTAVGFVTRVAEDDPLKAIPAAEFLRARQAVVGEALGRWSNGGGPHRFPPRVDDAPFRGAALAEHIGASSLLLLAAAVLLSQLFARRGLAFVGVLAAVALYVAALDRAVLGAHLSRMEGPNAPLPARVLACEQAADSFFYRKTALARLRELARDATVPGPLRARAEQMARELPGLM
ncbi:MAG TPA: hypothetical protein VNE39_12390 [Planctomycetota bacterium]|nr:hypothetical protein [Planctomycetota bacterium]